MLAVILLCVACCAYAILMRMQRKSSEPPVLPDGWPIIGHAPLQTLDNSRMWDLVLLMSERSLTAGGVATIFLGPKTVYVLTDPDDSHTAANACLQKSEFYEFARPWVGNGLISADVSIWKYHRKLLNPAFSQQVLDGFVEVFNRQARRLADNMAERVDSGPFDHWPYLALNGLETICSTALGFDSEVDQTVSSKYFDALEEMFHILIERVTKVWLHNDRMYSWTRLKRRQDQLLGVLHHMSEKVLQKRKLELNNNTDGKFKPFLDLLLELANEKGVFTDQEIREHVDTMIVAGHDTSANCLMYTLVLLGSYPDVQNKVYEEIQEVLGETDTDVTKHDFSKLVYMEAVIKESLRLFPIFPVVTRQVDRDVKLKNYTLSAGGLCFIILYGIHRHSIWGADAEQFRPERWLDPATLPSSPAAFAGFSIGRRACIGRTYAMMSMKTTLSHLLRRYKVTADHTKLKLKLGVMLKPESGHRIAIERRI